MVFLIKYNRKVVHKDTMSHCTKKEEIYILKYSKMWKNSRTFHLLFFRHFDNTFSVPLHLAVWSRYMLGKVRSSKGTLNPNQVSDWIRKIHKLNWGGFIRFESILRFCLIIDNPIWKSKSGLHYIKERSPSCHDERYGWWRPQNQIERGVAGNVKCAYTGSLWRTIWKLYFQTLWLYSAFICVSSDHAWHRSDYIALLFWALKTTFCVTLTFHR